MHNAGLWMKIKGDHVVIQIAFLLFSFQVGCPLVGFASYVSHFGDKG